MLPDEYPQRNTAHTDCWNNYVRGNYSNNNDSMRAHPLCPANTTTNTTGANIPMNKETHIINVATAISRITGNLIALEGAAAEVNTRTVNTYSKELIDRLLFGSPDNSDRTIKCSSLIPAVETLRKQLIETRDHLKLLNTDGIPWTEDIGRLTKPMDRAYFITKHTITLGEMPPVLPLPLVGTPTDK